MVAKPRSDDEVSDTESSGGTLKRLKGRFKKSKSFGGTINESEVPKDDTTTTAPLAEEESGIGTDVNGFSDDGTRGGEDDGRSKSSMDVRDGDSPPLSRRKKMWHSFRRKIRSTSRSRDKSRGDSLDDEMDPDQEGIDPSYDPAVFDVDGGAANGVNGGLQNERSASEPAVNDKADTTEKTPDKKKKKKNGVTSTLERRRKGKSLSQEEKHEKEGREKDKESEGDSGIAVVEHSDNMVTSCLGRRAPNTDKNGKDVLLRHRQTTCQGHPFYQLDIMLKEGRDLVIRDSCGTSDPYVKFKMGGKQLYRSRTLHKNLNPRWDEKFSLPIEDASKPLQVRVLDYDRGLTDDSMGGAEIIPSTLELNVPHELKLLLSERNKSSYMGFLLVQCTLIPKTQEDKEQYLKKQAKSDASSSKKQKTQLWDSVVTIVLVGGHDLLPMDDNGYSDPYVKFRLGNEKYKSKYKATTLTPKWLEQFDLHMFYDQTSTLEVSVWDHDHAGKDDIMGRATVDLSDLEHEQTHAVTVTLEDGAGIINILLSISGTTGTETVSDLASHTHDPKARENTVRKYGLFRSFSNLKDVGWLQVKAIKAQGLASADLGGKSDPFCVLELVNDRLQTHTEYKTLYPEWGKIFTFNVKDIHSILEVTVYDEDRDKKVEFLGKVAIPLLRLKHGCRHWYTLKDKKLLGRSKGAIQLELDFIYNHIKHGERRWYQLKDKKGMGRGKGAILFEMEFVYNHVKAAIRTFNPREEKYMQPDPKFKIAVLKRNIDRVSKIAEAGVEAGKFLQSCFDWESKARSMSAFIIFLIIVWNFELYMLPVTLLIVFLKNLLVVHIAGNLMKDKEEDDYVDDEEEDDDEDKDKKKRKGGQEEKKSFKEKLHQVQEVCLQVQEGMDMVASMGERMKNTFNWTVPWLSWLAIILLTIGTVILFHVPVRYLIMAFGINKFTKKLRAPNAIPNNELLDYLSRVPSDKELIMYRELRPDSNIGTMKRKKIQ